MVRCTDTPTGGAASHQAWRKSASTAGSPVLSIYYLRRWTGQEAAGSTLNQNLVDEPFPGSGGTLRRCGPVPTGRNRVGLSVVPWHREIESSVLFVSISRVSMGNWPTLPWISPGQAMTDVREGDAAVSRVVISLAPMVEQFEAFRGTELREPYMRSGHSEPHYCGRSFRVGVRPGAPS